MPEKGGGPSMFETVKKHGDLIETHDQLIEAHGQLIEAQEKSINELKDNYKKLEENDKKQAEKLDLLSNQMTGLVQQNAHLVQQNAQIESTILKSSQTQQEVFRETMSKQWDLIKARDNSKEAERMRVHEINLSEQALKKSKSEKRWELLGKGIASGGIIFLIIEAIIRIVGGQ